MPTYEYACASCHRHTEAVQRFTDPPLSECPHCGGRLRRVFHPVGIVLKGSGFYSTDNRASRRGGTGKEPVKTETKTETKSESKKESKAETKSESTKDSSNGKK